MFRVEFQRLRYRTSLCMFFNLCLNFNAAGKTLAVRNNHLVVVFELLKGIMIPDSVSSVVTTTKSPITSALSDYRYYSTLASSCNSSPLYLTSNASIIKAHSSRCSNLFSSPSTKTYELTDTNRSLNLKSYKSDDYSLHTRPLVRDKYTKSTSYDAPKKKSLQISPTYSTSKYQPSAYRSSSLLPTSTYVSKTVDSAVLDGNANYRTNGDTSYFERKLSAIKSNSTPGLRKHINDSTNNVCNLNDGYSSNNLKKESDQNKKDYSSGTYRRYSERHSGNDDANSNDETTGKWAGLRNIGNTCYMNSILQCLGSTKQLKEYLINKTYIKDINQDGKLISAFGNLITKLWSPVSQSSAVDVSSFKDIFQRLAPQFAGYEQHDAQEFLRFLIEKLHADVNRVHTKPHNLPEINDNLSDNTLASEHWRRYLMSENSFILELFVGQLKSTLQCLVCGNKSVTFEIFWDLSLPLPAYSSYSSGVTLADILRNFTQEEILDNREKPRCSRCKIEQRMAKSYSFQKLPKYLVLHLKRFQTTNSYKKLSTLVDFPLTSLDMSPFLAKSVIGSRRRYDLYAISNHNGTPFMGHYTANCKHPNSGEWYNCNDSTVTKISTPKLVNADAYILFYEAVD